MREISIYEAKAQLFKYISMIESGEESEIIILKNGQKVAKIVKEDSQIGQRIGAGLLVTDYKPFVVKDPSDNSGELFGY